MDIANALARINDENFIVWGSERRKELDEWIREYGYGEGKFVPVWFNRMIQDVLSRKSDYFLFDFDDEHDSNMSSLLLDLATRDRWIVDDYGEGVSVRFPVSRVDVAISREAFYADGRSCNSCKVIAEE